MKNVIYQITNMLNGKFYIGSAVSFPRRVWTHKNRLRMGVHHNKHLQAAWNKYGEAAFVFEVIEEVPEHLDLHAVESGYLRKHFRTSVCYNLTVSATAPGLGKTGKLNPMWGKTFSHSEETKAKIGLAAAFRVQTEGEKAKRSASMMGHDVSEETKELLRVARSAQPDPRLGKTHSDETKERIRQAKLANPTRAWLGKARSEDTKKKIGDAQRGKPKGEGRTVSEEGRAKIAANIAAGRSHMHWLGKSHTAESRLKMSRSVLAIDIDRVVTTYGSITELRSVTGLLPPTVNRALKSGKPLTKGKFAGWSFKYA